MNLTNLTIPVPEGATIVDGGHLLCVSNPRWTTALLVITFFATNYFAHAATVKSTPCERATVTACNIVLAVIFPMSGFASYHLTVLPYLVMTAVNFVGNAVTPDYSCLYMVRTEAMPEAQGRGGQFLGVFASIQDGANIDPESLKELHAWEGFKTNHLKTAVDLLAGYLSTIFTTSSKKDNCVEQEPIANANLTCNGLANTTSHDDTDPRFELVCDVGIYHILDKTSTPPDRMTVPISELLQKALSRSFESNYGRTIVALRQALHCATAQAKAQVLDEFPTDRTIWFSINLPFITIGRIFRNLFEPQIQQSGATSAAHDAAAQEGLDGLLELAFAASQLLVVPINRSRTNYRTESRKTVIYVPCCPPFRRTHDPLRSTRNFIGDSIEGFIGVSILALLVLAISRLSNWFDPGESSTTQRVVMLLWLCEGTIGLVLPMLSLKEMVLVFLFLPIYALMTHPTFIGNTPSPHVMFGSIPRGGTRCSSLGLRNCWTDASGMGKLCDTVLMLYLEAIFLKYHRSPGLDLQRIACSG
jgi:hypothetical protein